MATLRDYFDTDFSSTLSVEHKFAVSIEDISETVNVIGRAHFDFNAYVKFVSYYVPSCDCFDLNFCQSLIGNVALVFNGNAGGAHVTLPSARLFNGKIHVGHNGDNPIIAEAQFSGEENIPSTQLPFSGRIFLYCEQSLSDDELTVLKQQAQLHNLSIQFRGPVFGKERAFLEKPLAFISHDSNDKAEVARPLALELQRLMCPVWFDEFSLKVGDSLRESIEKGLKECKKCILVISPQFLANEGWTKVEFNSIFTREIIETTNLVLPIWKNVTSKDVYEYSPSLADRVALQWSSGVEEVARRVYQVIID